jgi:enoyl-CoA hydratase
MPDAAASITAEQDDRILRLSVDDGGRNVFTLPLARELHDRIRAAEADSAITTLVLEGNGRALSVGLDTGTVLAGGAEADALLGTMGEILRLLYLSRLRSVVIASGHAVAAGAMLLLVADTRIGIAPGGRVGLSEVGVGLPVPAATQQLVRDRIAVPYQYESTALARLHDYETARRIGFLDALVATREEASTLATEEGTRLAALDEQAYLTTKRGLRRAYADLVDGR